MRRPGPKTHQGNQIQRTLINWHSFDGDEALYAIAESKGRAYHISDKNMKEMTSFLLKKEGYRVLPASTAGLIGVLRMHEEEVMEEGRIVAVLTAKY